MPSQHCRPLFERMRPVLRSETMIVSATKGLEEDSLLRMTEVIAQVLARRIGSAHRRTQRPVVRARSGPRRSHGHHHRIAGQRTRRHSPARIQRRQLSRLYQRRPSRRRTGRRAEEHHRHRCRHLRRAWASGHNSVAALITRGLAEMTRLVVACGGTRRNHGWSGRSRRPGADLYRRTFAQSQRRCRTWPRASTSRKFSPGCTAAVAEGVFTTSAAVGLARARKVEMPITEQMYAILHDGKPRVTPFTN